MKIKEILILAIILFLAAFLRLYKLDQIPPSLDWDEVAIGWNAFSIFKYRIDEYGRRFPLEFQSFGDYKAPLQIYLTAPFVGLLGLSELSVRLPSAIFGIITVFIFYLISQKLSKNLNTSKNDQKIFSILSTLILAISPWHLLFSRPAFEPNLALMLISFGIYFLLLSLDNSKLWFFSGFFFILSLYSYHSPKLFLPFFLILFFIIFRKKILSNIFRHKIVLTFTVIILLLFSFPVLKSNLAGEGSRRFSGTSIFYNDKGELKPVNFNLFLSLIKNYFSHLSPRFYLYNTSPNYRTGLKNFGIIPTIQLIFLYFGLIQLIKNRKNKTSKILLVWFFTAFIPPMIGREVPHSLRSLNVLPTIIMISVFGFILFLSQIKKQITIFQNKISPKFQKILLTIIISFLFLNSQLNFFQNYVHNYPIYSAPDWQYGYKQAAKIASEYEANVDKIIITSYYGQPHIFTAFFQNRDPLHVLWGTMSKYQFRDINWNGDQFLKNHLLIGSPDQIPQNLPADKAEFIEEIKYPDGKIVFRIVKLK